MKCNTESIKWVWDQAGITADFQMQCADAMERQAVSLLNLLFVGAGGSLAYSVNLFEKNTDHWLNYAMAATSVWLFFVAAILVRQVMWSKEIMGPANDPANLIKAFDMDLSETLKAELVNSQICIEFNRSRNDSVGYWLNICRALTIITPMFIGLAVVAS